MIYLALLSAIILSYVLTIPTIYYAKKFKLVTDKRTRKHPAHTHKGIIPRAGGVPIYLSILCASLLFLPLNKILVGILIGGGLLVIMGLFDDHADVSPYTRFMLNILVSAIVTGFGLGIPFISNPFGDVIRLDTIVWEFTIISTYSVLVLANIFSILWLTWLMNMVNWSKGVDGQLPGFVAIAAIFLGILSQRYIGHNIDNNSVILFAFIVAGSFLGFLPFNMFPQRIMPGYGGGSLAGFLLGVLSILSFGKIGTAILILSVPMIDAIYAITRRIMKRQSPFKADWGHFHHKLLEIGWGKQRIALLYWVITFVLGISSLFLSNIEKVIAFLGVAVILLVFIIIIDTIKINNETQK